MNKAVFCTVNSIRILISIFFICMFISELFNIAQDPITYERVYTGEFLGKGRYESLSQLKITIIIQIIIVLIYAILTTVHIFILKNKKNIIWILRFMDIALITFIIYSLRYVFY